MCTYLEYQPGRLALVSVGSNLKTSSSLSKARDEGLEDTVETTSARLQHMAGITRGITRGGRC